MMNETTSDEITAKGQPLPADHGRRRPGAYHKHGLVTLKRAVRELGDRSIDRRTTLGRALAQWRTELINDLGGSDAVTTQQAAIVDLAVRTKLLVDSVDAYVLGMPSAVNKRRRCLYPVVKERQALVSQLQSLLRDLGLERRAKTLPDLNTYLATKANRETKSTDGGEGGTHLPQIDSNTRTVAAGQLTREG